MIRYSSKAVQWPETMLYKLVTFPYIHGVGHLYFKFAESGYWLFPKSFFAEISDNRICNEKKLIGFPIVSGQHIITSPLSPMKQTLSLNRLVYASVIYQIPGIQGIRHWGKTLACYQGLWFYNVFFLIVTWNIIHFKSILLPITSSLRKTKRKRQISFMQNTIEFFTNTQNLQ